jgi:deoxyribonuclease-4
MTRSGSLSRSAGRRLGIHIRTAGGLVAGARHAVEIGSTTMQIMSGNPSAWNPGSLDPKQATAFAAFLDEHDLRPVFLHAGYLINLSCRIGRNAPIYAKSVRLLQANIDRAEALSCEFVVVHLGSRMGDCAEASLEALLEGIGKLRSSRPLTLLLENSAGSGETVGASFEELAAIMEAVRSQGAPLPLGICLDTAHMWGAGYDLSSGPKVRRSFDDFDRMVGLEYLKLIHLNDSPVVRGARRDRHEHLGHGLIPLPALKAVVREPRLKGVPMIMETPGKTEPSDEKRMDDLWHLAGARK